MCVCLFTCSAKMKSSVTDCLPLEAKAFPLLLPRSGLFATHKADVNCWLCFSRWLYTGAVSRPRNGMTRDALCSNSSISMISRITSDYTMSGVPVPVFQHRPTIHSNLRHRTGWRWPAAGRSRSSGVPWAVRRVGALGRRGAARRPSGGSRGVSDFPLTPGR